MAQQLTDTLATIWSGDRDADAPPTSPEPDEMVAELDAVDQLSDSDVRQLLFQAAAGTPRQTHE